MTMTQQAALERRQRKDIGLNFHGKRSYDPETGRDVVKIFSGDWYVSTSGNEMLATILGSCIAACIRDTELGIAVKYWIDASERPAWLNRLAEKINAQTV